MYIRKTRRTKKKKSYYYYQLVESHRTPKGPRQRILLNLGTLDEIKEDELKSLANRIEELATGQHSLIAYPPHIEKLATHYAAFLKKQTIRSTEEEVIPQWEEVDLTSVQSSHIRTAGSELIAEKAAHELSLKDILKDIGFTKDDIDRALIAIMGKLINPGSEIEIYNWYNHISGLQDLLNIDNKVSLTSLYRIHDRILSHKDDIEKALINKERSLFGLGEGIILYDLTNTYFEGMLSLSDMAKRGVSKEKRNDRPLISVALIIDSEGFPKTIRVYPGNISEPSTLNDVLDDLIKNKPPLDNTRPVVVMDAGITTEENLTLIKNKGFDYICTDRRKIHKIPEKEETIIRETDHTTISAIREETEDEVFLIVHSDQRAKKEEYIKNRFQLRLEEDLKKLSCGLNKKGCIKQYPKILEKIGRLKEKYSMVSHYYEIDIKKEGNMVKDISWSIKNEEKLKTRFSGRYILRSSKKDIADKELWSIHNMLTNIEASFKSLKYELSLRPVHHRLDKRIMAHIFITFIAYHLLCVIQRRLREHNIRHSWNTIRTYLSSFAYVTTTMMNKKNKTVYIRHLVTPEPFHIKIFNAMGISSKSIRPKIKIK